MLIKIALLISVIWFRSFTCSLFLGKPSRMKPFCESGWSSLCFRISIIKLSGIKFPLLMILSTSCFSSPCVDLRRSPVEIFGMFSSLAKIFA